MLGPQRNLTLTTPGPPRTVGEHNARLPSADGAGLNGITGCGSEAGTRDWEGGVAGLRRVLVDGMDSLFRFILVRVGPDRASAEDLLQQTVTIALERRLEFASDRDVERWVRGVARNLIRAHWRGGERRAPGGAELVDALAGSAAPEEISSRDETSADLAWAIASLCDDDQRLLYAFYKHGLGYAEIAAQLGVTEKGVEARLYRMRRRLREALCEADGSCS